MSYEKWRNSPELCASLSRLIHDPVFLNAKQCAIEKASPSGAMMWQDVVRSPDDKIRAMGVEHVWLTGFMAAFRALEDISVIGQKTEEHGGVLPPPFDYIEDYTEE